MVVRRGGVRPDNLHTTYSLVAVMGCQVLITLPIGVVTVGCFGGGVVVVVVVVTHPGSYGFR